MGTMPIKSVGILYSKIVEQPIVVRVAGNRECLG